MRGLAFPSDAEFKRETSHEYGTPITNGDDIPIDPALGGPAIDPAIMGESSTSVGHIKPPEHAQLQPPSPFLQRYSPSRQYSQEPKQYSQAPQGDPFAPQPSYLPIVEAPPPPQKHLKKKRRPRREEECGFCSGNDFKNKQGEPEVMVTCEDCGRSGHPSCMELGEVGDVVRSYPWKCVECKICEVCHEKGDDERILFCDFCDRGWHMDCLPTPLKDSPPGRWHCPLCPPLAPNDIFYDPPTEHIQCEPQVSEELHVGSSSPSYPGKGKGMHSGVDSLPIEDEESNVEIVETPLPVKTRGRPRKIKVANDVESERIPSPSRPSKRMRLRVSSPTALPRIRLRLPARKGRDRDDDDEHRKGIFDDILSVDERDVTKSSVEHADKQRFERSRLAAELKLAPPLPPPPPSISLADENVEISTPGSSRPLRSSTLQAHPLAISTPVSASPGPSTPGPVTKAGPLPPPPLRIRTIRFGQFDIQTWYDAPFPEEYANIPDGRLWICEFCLKYMKSRFGAVRHRMKCKARNPPGDEIYRDGYISVFEVDGRKNKIYCQNLCLLSKMFLDHKSLFYDVEPFLFYVMTEVDDVGARFVGYFSKEKRSPKDYNVSCIMTLPVRQRKGWGNLLIDFSYLLSKKEQRSGSPEKPLSGLGALGYKNYWTLTVMRYLESAPDHPKLEDISAATSMTIEDICITLAQHNMISMHEATPPIIRPSPGQSIKFPKGRKNGVARRHLQRVQTQDEENAKAPFVIPKRYDISWDRGVVMQFLERWEEKGYPKLKPEKLKWSPFLSIRLKKSEKSVGKEVDRSVEQSQRTSTRRSSSRGFSTPTESSNPRDNATTSFDTLPVYSATEGGEDKSVALHTSRIPNEALQIEQDNILAREWVASVPKRRLRSQSTRSSSGSIVSRSNVVRESSTSRSAAHHKRSSSVRTPENEHGMDDQAAKDEALATKLEREERRASRLLRPRSNTGSVKGTASPSTGSRVSSPRKRRRVESSPEVDTPSMGVNGTKEDPPVSVDHQLTNGSGTVRPIGDESVPLPHGGIEAMPVQMDEVERDAPEMKSEDVGTLVTRPSEVAAAVEVKKDLDHAEDDEDADADGEYDEDAEGELDEEFVEELVK